MTGKLEEIKSKKLFEYYRINSDFLNLKDVEWLIEQAEQIEIYKEALLKIVNTPEDSFESFEDAYLSSVRIAMKVMNIEE